MKEQSKHKTEARSHRLYDHIDNSLGLNSIHLPYFKRGQLPGCWHSAVDIIAPVIHTSEINLLPDWIIKEDIIGHIKI